MVTLLDGTIKTIHIVGEVKITPSLNLHKVLFVLEFKYNLFSIGRFLHTHKHITTQFTSISCCFQDLSIKDILAKGDGSNGLYKLHSCIPSTVSKSYSTSCTAHSLDTQTIYDILGHIS